MKDPDRKFAADTVAAIGLCAQQFPKVANTCLEGLLALASHGKHQSIYLFGNEG